MMMMNNSMANSYSEAGTWTSTMANPIHSSKNDSNFNSRRLAIQSENRPTPTSSSPNNSNCDIDIFLGGTSRTATTTSSIPHIQLPLPPLMLCSDQDAKPCKSHKEAERRRRKRINAHLATLRSLLPNLLKTDKASVLGEVVQRVKELKKAALELTADYHGDGDGDRDGDGDGDAARSCLLPGDMDDLTLRRSENDSSILVATLCCEDRPELIVDLTRALRSVKGRVVRAEMATVGGRTKSILWVRGVGGGGSSASCGGGPEGLLRRALKVVVDKPSSSSSGNMGHHLGLLVGSRIRSPYYYY